MTDESTGNEQGWQIAGHNGIVVDPATGVVTSDEYAKKNLRTVSIDLDRDGKYIEFAVDKGSAKLRDYLNALERKLRVAREALEEIEEAGTDAGIYPPYVVAREALRQLDEVGAYTERDK